MSKKKIPPETLAQKPQIDVRDPQTFVKLYCSNNDTMVVHNNGAIEYIIMDAKLTNSDKNKVRRINDLLKNLPVNLNIDWG